MNLEFFMGIAVGMACCGIWMLIFREKKQPRDERGRFTIVGKHLLVHKDDYVRMSEAIDHIHNRFTPKDERSDYKELCRKLDGDKQ